MPAAWTSMATMPSPASWASTSSRRSALGPVMSCSRSALIAADHILAAMDFAWLVARALAEDIGDGDVTSLATVPEDARATATITQKAPGVLYGFDVTHAA